MALSCAMGPAGELGGHVAMGETERCQEAAADGAQQVTCAEYESAYLHAAKLAGTKGHRFTCPFGVRSFWLAVDVEGACIAVLAIYACTTNGHRRRKRRRHAPDSDDHPERRRNARLAPSPHARFSIGDDDHTMLIIR